MGRPNKKQKDLETLIYIKEFSDHITGEVLLKRKGETKPVCWVNCNGGGYPIEVKHDDKEINNGFASDNSDNTGKVNGYYCF